MTYTKTIWKNDSEPAINADRLNNIENGIYDLHETKVDDVLNKFYPIGSIVEFDRNVDPNTTIGGTWSRFGNGRVTVGLDTTQTEFSTVNKTGGTKTHILTINEMPLHTHKVSIRQEGEVYGFYAETSGGTYEGGPDTTYVGGNQAHNNLQPYIVVYRWVRTA